LAALLSPDVGDVTPPGPRDYSMHAIGNLKECPGGVAICEMPTFVLISITDINISGLLYIDSVCCWA
jgi:hypothetical protein